MKDRRSMDRSNPTQTEESKFSLNQRQFGIRHLLVATLVAALPQTNPSVNVRLNGAVEPEGAIVWAL
jgi:hypothetical protein